MRHSAIWVLPRLHFGRFEQHFKALDSNVVIHAVIVDPLYKTKKTPLFFILHTGVL